MTVGWWVWALFGALVLAMIALDLGELCRVSLTIILGAVAISAAASLLMIPARPSPGKLEKA